MTFRESDGGETKKVGLQPPPIKKPSRYEGGEKRSGEEVKLRKRRREADGELFRGSVKGGKEKRGLEKREKLLVAMPTASVEK